MNLQEHKFAPILKDVFENGKILVIDEIERSLHPSLVEMIIKFFHSIEINKSNAQLIFNTHDTNLSSLYGESNYLFYNYGYYDYEAVVLNNLHNSLLDKNYI